jgi:AcrR family transcriptional regulator
MGHHSAGVAQIRYLRGAEGLSIRTIAARLGLSKDTVSRAVASSFAVAVFAGEWAVGVRSVRGARAAAAGARSRVCRPW